MPSAASQQNSRPNSGMVENVDNDTGRLLRDIGQGLGYGGRESVDEGSDISSAVS